MWRMFNLISRLIAGAPKSWIYQTWIYVGLMAVIKLITTLFIQMDFWDNVKEFVLSPFQDPQIELVFVMLVIPFFINVSAVMNWRLPRLHLVANRVVVEE